MCIALAYVRFTPESDVKSDIWECPLWAKSGHVWSSYSMTSSMMDNTPAGMLKSSAFAALRLSTNSNFVG
jgi:hypothetical protein